MRTLKIVLASALIIVALAFALLDGKASKNVATAAVNLDSVKSELGKVETGDFVEYEGRWYQVWKNQTTPSLDNIEVIRLYYITPVDLYLFNADRVGRIVRLEGRKRTK